MYTEIEDMVIRSDGLPQSPKEVSIKFCDTTLVLCTRSMLSNPRLDESHLLDIIPVRTLVVDEASQIDVFEFMVIPRVAFWIVSDALDPASVL